MTTTITYGLVAQATTDGVERPATLLKSVSGTYEERYRCDYCSEYFPKGDLTLGTSWECLNCGEYREITDSYSVRNGYVPECCVEDMIRRDGEDGTLAGFLCPNCEESRGARIVDTPEEVLRCGECDEVVGDDGETTPEQHLFDHLDKSWE